MSKLMGGRSIGDDHALVFTMQPEISACLERNFHFFIPLLSWTKFLSHKYFNHYIDRMGKILSANACNARVAGLDKSFVQRNISAVRYRATIFLSVTACCRISPSQNACVVCRGESASMKLIGLWVNVRSGRGKAQGYHNDRAHAATCVYVQGNRFPNTNACFRVTVFLYNCQRPSPRSLCILRDPKARGCSIPSEARGLRVS